MREENNSKEIILNCALKLFAEQGYNAVGISAIVEAAGITKPTLYYFYHSKEGVLREILEQYYGRFNDMLSKICHYEPHISDYKRDVYPQLIRIVKEYFTFASENKVFYMMMLSLSYTPPESFINGMVKPFNQRQYEILNGMFTEIAKAHHNLKGKEWQCACHFAAIINANISFWYNGFGNLDDKNAANIVKQFMHGIFV